MSTSPETSSSDSNSCHVCNKVFKTSSGLKYHTTNQVCIKTQHKKQQKEETKVTKKSDASPPTKVPVLITPIKPPQKTPAPTSKETANNPTTASTPVPVLAKAPPVDPAQASTPVNPTPTPQPATASSEYRRKQQTSMEDIVANQLDPTKKKLLYVEKGYKHKTGLDPKRFDCLRFLKVANEENPDIPFEEIMSKTEYLLKDPFFWIRWRDVSTH